MNCGNETWHVVYLLGNQPWNNDHYVILKRFRAHLHCNKIRKVWQQTANIFSCMLLMSHTWFLACNKYCTDPWEESQTLKGDLHTTSIQYSSLHNLPSLIIIVQSSTRAREVWMLMQAVLYVRGVDVPLHGRTSLITPSISPQQRNDPQSSVGRIMRSRNYKVVSFLPPEAKQI